MRKEQKSLPKLAFENLKSVKFHYKIIKINFVGQFSFQIDIGHFAVQDEL